MAETKYLDYEGVKTLWKKIKATFFGKAEGEALTNSVNDLSTRIDQISTESGQQKTFSNVKVGSTTVAATTAGDAFSLVGGENVTLEADATNKTVTIKSKDTTYPVATDSIDGLMAAADKKRLDSIETNAQANRINTIVVNGSALTPDTSKSVSLTIPTAVSQITNDSGFQTADDVKSAISAAVTSAYVYKGSVDTADALPTDHQSIGDVYNIVGSSSYGPEGMNVAWTGTAWDALGSSIAVEAMTADDVTSAIAEADRELQNA